MFIFRRRAGVWLCLLSLTCPAALAGQATDNVLLVINDNSPASVEVGEYYAKKRAIAQDHVVHIKTVPTEVVDRAEYSRAIKTPIGTWISKNGFQDRILFLVLAKGVPLRIAGTEGPDGTTASVDSELTLLYRELLGMAPPVAGRVPNPYFLADRPVADAKPFTRLDSDVYLVTRLDGFTVDDARKAIDRASAPSQDGKIVLDEKAALVDRGGDQWLRQAAERLRQSGAADRVLLEETRDLAATSAPVLGYYSWGSNDPANLRRQFGLRFANGAIAGMFVSTDGRTFAEPPTDWKPSDPNGRGPKFGGTFQSLAGDLIRDGMTGIAAHVAEPYLDATIRPQILFPAYLSGLTLAESFYLAMPFLSWQTIVVGDPLCAPFKPSTPTADRPDGGIDPVTELPALFAERRVRVLSRGELNADAVRLTLKADVQALRGQQAEAEKLWELAANREPRLVPPRLQLASLHQQRGEFEKAIDRYRQVARIDPQNVVALNNLAVILAERRHTPREALPFAERAFRISSAPDTADTVGWIHHLLGDDRSAAPLLERATAGAPDNAEILLHAAVVHMGLNDPVRAKAELDAAEKQDPRLADRAEAKALREKLKGGGPDKSLPADGLSSPE